MRRVWLIFDIFLSIALTACLSSKVDNARDHYKYSQELPLSVGNYWAYQVTRYDGFNPVDIMTTTFVMTDTITRVEAKEGFVIATVQSEQSAEVPVEVRGNYPVTDTLKPATAKSYWLIVDGTRVLRQEDTLDLSDLQSRVRVEYVFPIGPNSTWSIYNAKDAPINRKVTRLGSITVPAGEFANCYYLDTVMGGMTLEDWFCPGIGMVQHNAEHHGTPYGNRQELVSYRTK